jgi:hypothetical protein
MGLGKWEREAVRISGGSSEGKSGKIFENCL